MGTEHIIYKLKKREVDCFGFYNVTIYSTGTGDGRIFGSDYRRNSFK